MVEIIPLRRQRDFRLLWSARAVSETGSEISRLAVPLTAATLLNVTPIQMGLLTAATTLPYLLIGLPAGAYADRIARRRPILIGCEIVSAVAVFTVPLAWLAGLLTISWLIAVALTVGTCAVFYRAVWFPHLPSVVPDHQRTAAIAGFQMVYSTASVCGPGLAGLLVQILTAPLALVADATSFLVSAVCLRSIRSPEKAERPDPAVVRPNLLRDIREGMRTVMTHRTLRALIGAGVLINFASAAQMALYVLFAVQTLGLPTGVLGLLIASAGIGGLLGAAVAPRLTRRFTEDRVILGAAAVLPLEFIAVASAHGPFTVLIPLLTGAFAISGAATVMFSVCYGTLQLRESPPDMLGRVNAIMTVSTMGVMTLGGVVGGVLGELIGLRPALWACAALAGSGIFLVWFSPLRRSAFAARLHHPASDPSDRVPVQ
ncbi:MFS transporter [Sphaerisporangium perillae]|uniref:MFS transporter n=1 Tax=Sphaerisporangium perillae TaxID=2935860 RepID=UPI00200F330D|nr:MFS transporter [Sphaerisporangium perillae]